MRLKGPGEASLYLGCEEITAAGNKIKRNKNIFFKISSY